MDWRRQVGVIVGLVALATPVVAFLELGVGIPDASAVYLVAVVLSAMTAGTAAAVGTAAAAVLTYDLLFTEPFMAPTITDSSEWLSLVLFSFVGVTVGQLVAVQRRRTQESQAREREAQDLQAVSHVLATRASTSAALGDIAAVLVSRAAMERVWFALTVDDGPERSVADSGGPPIPRGGTYLLLRRAADTGGSAWAQVHEAASDRAGAPAQMRLRVPIASRDGSMGSLWALRARSATPPDASVTRLLTVVADQVGEALRHDRLASDAAELEIERASSALKSALVESVSHDLRTPLVSIRAAAGTLKDPDVALDRLEVASAAASIDRQAARLDRIVKDLLDLGRIQGGTLTVMVEAVELGELVERVRARLRDDGALDLDERLTEVAVAGSWVDADPVLLEQAALNVLENAWRHTPHDAVVRVVATRSDDGRWVRLAVEDSGPGVAEADHAHLFTASRRRSRSASVEQASLGIGLTIVRGFVEAMGGHVSARRSQLGGLGVELELPATRMPDELASTPPPETDAREPRSREPRMPEPSPPPNRAVAA